MMNYVFGGMVILSIIFAFFSGNLGSVTNSVLEEGVNAIELVIYLMGGMCVWGGVMRIAEKAGITEVLAKLFTPLSKFLFNGIDAGGKAFKAMTMNITANLLGLGNAATPFGITAMQELEKEEKTDDVAGDNMIIFTVLNTASITLIPTTIASLRLKHGAENPMDILPVILFNSLVVLVLVLTFTKVMNYIFAKDRR
jgi:spore maturation protein A